MVTMTDKTGTQRTGGAAQPEAGGASRASGSATLPETSTVASSGQGQTKGPGARPEDPHGGSGRLPAVSRLVAIGLWVLVWQLASMLVKSNLLLSGPVETFARLCQLLVQPKFLSIVWFSSARILSGFLLAYASAVVLAIVAHRWPQVGSLLAPAIQVLKAVPLACVIVLLLMWVGSRAVSGPAVFLAVFPAVYFSCAEGLANVDAKVGEMLTAFRVRGAVRLCAHVWPSVLPYLVGTAKNVCGMAWKAGIAAELIGSPMGSVGERIYQSKILLETADLFAWTIVVVALSVLCEQLFVALLARSGRLSRRLALALARHGWGVAPSDSVPSGIMLENVTLGYPNAVVARGVNASCGPGSRSVLSEASGTGKTTFLRTVAGLLPVLDGKSLLLPPTVSMVFQEARLIEEMTAVQNVQLVAGGACDEGTIRVALAELLPAAAHDVPVAELSGGQRRRVELVRALLCPASAVLLDEPFASLDAHTHEAAASFVRHRVQGRTLLVASHAPSDAQLLGAEELRLFGR